MIFYYADTVAHCFELALIFKIHPHAEFVGQTEENAGRLDGVDPEIVQERPLFDGLSDEEV
jgi:hypothetical protein